MQQQSKSLDDGKWRCLRLSCLTNWFDHRVNDPHFAYRRSLNATFMSCRVFLGMRHSKNPPTFRWKCDVLKSSRNWLVKRLKLAKNYDQQKSQITSCSPPKSHVFNFGPDVATNQFEVLSWGNGCVSWGFITKRLQKLPNIKSRCW